MKKPHFIWILLLIITFSAIRCNKEDKSEELVQCIKLNFDIALGNQLQYTFLANFEDKENVLYSWYVDEIFQEEDGKTTSGIPDHKFSTTLDPGTHEICIISQEDCVGTKVFCRTVVSSVDCEKFSFTRNNNTLIADFNSVQSFPEYKWYVDGVEIKTDGTFVGGDNTFDISNLDLGSYEICISSSFCEDSFDFCKSIEISEDAVDCQVFSFKREDKLLIPTFPDFANFQSYSWYVDGVETDKDGTVNKGDNRFDLSTLSDGTYNICIQSELCEANVTFCDDITIANSSMSCSEFTFRKEDGFLVPTFTDFTTFPSYSWFVNGVEEDKDGLDNAGDNKFNLYTLENGSYTICLQSDLCDESFNTCQTIEVNFETDCRILFYEQQGNLLVANFPGIETERSYDWYVNGKVFKRDGIFNNGNNQLDLNNLESGIYQICMLIEGCDPQYDYCKQTVQVGDPNNMKCPKLSYSRNGNRLIASFTGIDTHSLYRWVVETDPVKEDGVSVSGDNTLDLSGFSPGEYKICIFSPGCSVGNYFCDRITIN